MNSNLKVYGREGYGDTKGSTERGSILGVSPTCVSKRSRGEGVDTFDYQLAQGFLPFMLRI